MPNVQSIITFLTNQIGLQRDTLFLWIPVFVGLGILLFFGFDLKTISLPHVLIATIVLFTGTALARYFYQSNPGPSLLYLFYIGMAISLVFSGICTAKARSMLINTPILQQETFVDIEATIEKLSLLEGGKAKRVTLRDIQLREEKNIQLSKIRLRTYHFKGDSWKTGDRIRITAKLLPPSPPVLPGGFDFRFKAKFEGLSATGFTIKDALLINPAPKKWLNPQSVRDDIAKQVYDVMSPRYAALSLALLTGERSGIEKNDAESMRASGLAHILAISGLHVGLVAGCMFFFVRLFLSIIPGFALRYPIKKWAALSAIIVALFYMILAGATVPTVRAFIMTSLVLTAIIMDRSALNLRLVAIAALFIMFTTPEVILGPSFQLSFAAVTALVAFYQAAGRRWFMHASAFHPIWRPVYYLLGVIMTTIVATLATAPFSIYFFNRFAAFSVLSNILAMPLMTFVVMPFGLLSILTMPFGLIDSTWIVMEYGVSHVITIASAIAQYPYANLYFSTYTPLQMSVIGISFIWLVLWQGSLRWVGICIICFVMVLSASTSYKRIFISDDARGVLIANTVTDETYKSGKLSKYVRTQWLSSMGVSPHTPLETPRQCDDFICLVKIDEIHVAIIKNPMALQSACSNNDIIIADFPINEWQDCNQARAVIDRFDVWRNGAISIDIDSNQFKVQSANPANNQ